MLSRGATNGLINIAFIWIAAAVFNPNIDSGTVWFVCMVVALLTTDIYASENGRRY